MIFRPSFLSALVIALVIVPPSAVSSSDGIRWIAERIVHEGGEFGTTLELNAGEVFSAQLWLYRGTDFLRGLNTIGYRDDAIEINADSSRVSLPSPVVRESSPPRLSIGYSNLDPGSYLVVAWVGGDVESWSHALQLPPSSSVTAQTQGDRTYLVLARDFDTGASVDTPVPGLNVGALNTRQYAVEDTLLGSISTGEIGKTSLSRPNSSQACPCFLADLGPEPGEYHVRRTGIAPSESPFFSKGVISIADVRVPAG